MGLQWGDEGKGKVIDILASRSDVVIRSQGGNNAGHTVQNGDDVYKLHLIPSGILYKNIPCLIGCGTVIDPQSILQEIDGLESRGISCNQLKIDPRAHVVMPWHLELDALTENMRGSNDIGTTRRGIGPCYMDKSERIGLRICDIIDPEILAKKATQVCEVKNKLINLYGGNPIDINKVIADYTAYGERLKKYVDDVSVLAYNAIKDEKKVLFEGAQATLLDIDMGTYPFVTSSHPVSGGVCTGVGIGPKSIDNIIGVGKAYTTRVGKGPFPTELLDDIGETIRQKGAEFGTTTGRPRRTGWFDAVVVRHGVRVNGLTSIAINKLDTLSGIGDLKVCVSYKLPDGSIIKDFPASLEALEKCEPIYEVMPGFDQDISSCKSYDELPAECKNYIEYLEKICDCPISMVGIGPARTQVLER